MEESVTLYYAVLSNIQPDSRLVSSGQQCYDLRTVQPVTFDDEPEIETIGEKKKNDVIPAIRNGMNHGVRFSPIKTWVIGVPSCVVSFAFTTANYDIYRGCYVTITHHTYTFFPSTRFRRTL
jgi:hypothetical protein